MEENQQYLIVQAVFIMLFIFLIFTISITRVINPPSDSVDSQISSFDPIFVEFVELENKAKLLDEYNPKNEIDILKATLKKDEERPEEINVDRLRDNQKYQNELLLKRVEAELAVFNSKDTYQFKSNYLRYEKYTNYLNEINKYVAIYYKAYEVFDINKAIQKEQKELEFIKDEVKKYPKYKIVEYKDMGLAKMTENEVIKRLDEEIKQRQLAVGYAELLSKEKETELSIIENKTKKIESINGIYERQIKLMDSITRFKEEIINYYKYIIMIRSIIFI